jgi:hypothetical protein
MGAEFFHARVDILQLVEIVELSIFSGITQLGGRLEKFLWRKSGEQYAIRELVGRERRR